LPIRALLRGWWLAGISTAAMGQAAVGQAPARSEAAPPPEDRQQASPDEQQVIVVEAPSERTAIDRTTYVVRDTALSRSSSVLDLLDRIPSIQVTPSGQIRLLGRSGVRILIDGNEVANPVEALRNLQGAQVARIEVISNPSAQFSAQGTGGIINIITRRSFAAGIGGSLTANAGSFGAFDLKASPTWTRGRLSLSGTLGFTRTGSHSYFASDRREFDANGAPVSETAEDGSRRNRGETRTGNVTAVFRPTPKQSVSLTALAVHSDIDLSRMSEIVATLVPVNPLTQIASGTVNMDVRDFSIDYRREGSRPGQALTLAGGRSTSQLRAVTAFSTDDGIGPPRPLELRTDSSTAITNANFNYNWPFGSTKRLALGASVQHTRDFSFTAQSGELPLGQGAISASSTIRGSWIEEAAYITYQFPLLGGTVLAGLRVEGRSYDLDGGSSGSAPHGIRPFPSLHAERTFGRGPTVSLSYSRRISWPGIADLNPALRFSDSTTANAGNPLLRPEMTDSFEGKLRTRLFSQSVELTLFTRRTHDLQSSEAELSADGVLIIRQVNLGSRASSGMNLIVQGTVAQGLSYVLTGNLADQSIERNGANLDLFGSGVQYSGSLQLEYRDGTEGRRGADDVQLRLRYSGPVDLGLFRVSPFTSSQVSWSHAFTDHLSSVLTISDPFGSPTVRSTFFSGDVVSRQNDRVAGPRVTFSLTYSLSPSTRR
jgi:outer membrane receptor protein involved in Fe transport